MQPSAPGYLPKVWAQRNDSRVTPLGRVLREYRVDELPHLVKVLRGDMNIVGPRPGQPEIVMRLRAAGEEYPSRQQVLPGITGWAQVNQHCDSTVDHVRRKVQLDLSTSGDAPPRTTKIMARTLPAVLFQKGGW